MNGLPYDPNRPGSLPWAAQRIQKVIERERREAMQRSRRSAREHAMRQEPGPASNPRATAPENVIGPVGDMFLARWGRGGLLDPDLWARETLLAAPVAPLGTMGGPPYRAVAPMPPSTYR